jgi:hypothetical protein
MADRIELAATAVKRLEKGRAYRFSFSPPPNSCWLCGDPR